MNLKKEKKVTFQTNKGNFTIALDCEKAPKTTDNFLKYVEENFFNGTIFHRVINNFMIQGGGFESGLKQKKTRETIENEANNGLKNTMYSVAMARTNDPHSATSQFFINVANNDFLDHTSPTKNGWGYAVFGKVISGTEVIDKIKIVETTTNSIHQDVPKEEVIIQKAFVETNIKDLI